MWEVEVEQQWWRDVVSWKFTQANRIEFQFIERKANLECLYGTETTVSTITTVVEKNDSAKGRRWRWRRRKEHLVKVSQELKAGWVLINEICTALFMFTTLHACHTNSLAALTRNRNLRDAIKFIVVRWKLKKKFSNALTCFVVVVIVVEWQIA